MGSQVILSRLLALFHQPIFIFITLWGHLCVLGGMVGFYEFERGINPRVNTLLDALFWAISTVTTVGYGDITPVTTGGKLVAIFLMLSGSLFLWSYTALFTGALIAPDLREFEEDVRELETDLTEEEQNLQELMRQTRELLRALEKRKR